MNGLRSILATLTAFLFSVPLAWSGLPTVDPPELYVPHSLEAFREAIRSGGPGKDGIPSIDRPHFQDADAADGILDDGDRVVGVYLHGEARAYPQHILVWHEIVNDEFGGEALSITYCPLTGTALGFKSGETQLGVSGKLVNSNLIMYDRATDSEWPQILGVAIDGPLAGKGLDEVRVIWTTWGAWKARHPGTRVLSERTGFVRNYHRDPYGSYNPVSGYYAPQTRRLFPVMHRDDRFPPKTEIFGFRTDEGAAAVTMDALRDEAVINLDVGSRHYAVIHDDGLGTGWAFHNPDGVEIRMDELDFTAEGVTGLGIDGLEPVNSFEAMWFAWAAFYPDTLLYQGRQHSP